MNSLLEQLRRIKDDRGMMADLRCVLVDGKKHRAWPALHRIHVQIEDQVRSQVAGLYATHPEEAAGGNFGTTCKLLDSGQKEQYDQADVDGEDKKKKKDISPIERRFQHLLAAEARQELFDRVTRLVLMAKAKGVPVNYEQLVEDLEPRRWEFVRQKWAMAFWNANDRPVEGGAL